MSQGDGVGLLFYKTGLVIRSGVFWLWMILMTLLLGLPVMIGALISYNLGYWVCKLWLQANLYGLKYLCGLSWRVIGAENIPDEPCLVLAKHQSTWETYFLPLMLGNTVYVAKRSLVRIPIFGWSLYLLRFILIDRSSGSSAISQMVEQSREALARGRWIIIFPEGTRKPVGAEPDYRIGGAVVARKAGARVLPVALNAGEFWPRLGFIKWPGVITVHIAPPIDSTGKSASQIMSETQEAIESRMAELPRADHPGAPRPPVVP